MRVLFVVQGEGRGHLMQAIAVSRMLKSAGHDVVEVLVGKSCGRVIPQFFYEQIGAPVHCFDSPNFMPTVRNQRPPLLRSVAYNIVRLPRYALSVRFIYQRIRAGRVDMVLNFYELLTGMLYFFCRPSASHVCVGHQLLFLHRDFRFPGANRLSWCSLKLFTWMASFGAERKLALSFREMPDDESHDIFVVPPLLRREVVTARPSDGRYIHGYMVNAGFSESVEAWHRQHPEVELHFFRDRGGDGGAERVDATLTFHAIDDRAFLRSLCGCAAYATTAGFESVCEAMYLGKPLLLVPAHIEQECNAYDAALSGGVVVADDFRADDLLRIARHHRRDMDFVRWVDSCDARFMAHLEAAVPLRVARVVWA